MDGSPGNQERGQVPAAVPQGNSSDVAEMTDEQNTIVVISLDFLLFLQICSRCLYSSKQQPRVKCRKRKINNEQFDRDMVFL
jgi:hypothetical protein